MSNDEQRTLVSAGNDRDILLNESDFNFRIEEDHEEILVILKKGVKLPKSDSAWSTAKFFKAEFLNLNWPIRSDEVNSIIKRMNEVIYSNFEDNYRNTKDNGDAKFATKYKRKLIKELKKNLSGNN